MGILCVCCTCCCKCLCMCFTACLKAVERYIIIILNTILVVIGIVTLGMGIGLKLYLSEGSNIGWMVPLLLTAGGCILAAAICGCMSCVCTCAVKFIPNIAAIVLLVVAVIFESTFLGSLNKQHITFKDFVLNDNLTNITSYMQEYDTDTASRIFWDTMQLKYECCGLHTVNDWKDAQVIVPATCCKEYSPKKWLEDNEGYMDTDAGKAAKTALAEFVEESGIARQSSDSDVARKSSDSDVARKSSDSGDVNRSSDSGDANRSSDSGVKTRELPVIPNVLSCDKTIDVNLKAKGCFEVIDEYFQMALKWFKVGLYVLIVFLVATTIFYVYYLLRMKAAD